MQFNCIFLSLQILTSVCLFLDMRKGGGIKSLYLMRKSRHGAFPVSNRVGVALC